MGLPSETLIEQHNSIILELKKANDQSTLTKKELVRKLIDTARPLLANGFVKGLKSSQLASYINQQLLVNKIEYPRNENFYSLFTDSEKREYGTNVNSTTSRIEHEHNWVGDDFEKICECGDILRAGKHYSVVVEEPDPEPEKFEINKTKQDKTPKRPYSNPTTDYLSRLAFVCEDYAKLLRDQIKKYNKYESVAEALDEYYTQDKLTKLTDEVKSLEAKVIHADKSSDARQKVGEFEKIKAYILQQTTHTVAHVAKIINITPKHMTNNVIRNIERSRKMMRWFKTVFITCPYCKKQSQWEAYDWFNEQCERSTLDLDMQQPLVPIK